VRVLIHPADTGACGHYRLIWPGRMLDRERYDVRVGDPETPTAEWPEDMKVYGKYMRDFDGEELMIGLGKPIEADVLVLQRPLSSAMPGLAYLVKEESDCALVVELDDDFTSIHPQNVSFWSTHPRLNPQRSVRNILAMIQHADLVTVSTTALKKVYEKHTSAPVVVVPNYVPSWYLTTERAGLAKPAEYEGKLLLGWSGSLETHPQDLQVVGGAVAQVLRENENVALTIVGTGRGVSRAFGTKAGGEILTTGWVPLSQYPSVMKELDVGMVPLQASRFNEGKSWLKGLEWASLGVPFVASPTMQYEALYQLGAGLIADDSRRWKQKLTALVQNIDLRQDTAARGRVAAGKLVMNDHLERWWEAWQSARDLKSRSRVLNPTVRQPRS
jgi:glycosyltransferase involved in cell wall biosynthesis